MRTSDPAIHPADAWCLATFLALCLAAASLPAQELGQWSFADGAKDWMAINQATVSDVTRRPGGKSLLIRQTKDDEANSAWLSPVLANPGRPVRVSLWSASNYHRQQDHSYAAAFELVPCRQDGTLTTAGGDWTYMPWEDKRQIPQFIHTLTTAGLQWKHYAADKRVTGDFFRVRFCWPKSMMRGECYLTDVQVGIAEGTADQGTVATVATGRHALEISCAASGNLFFSDDPLRFEFLLYSTDGKEVGALAKPELRYDITDYEHFRVAAGTIDFATAAALAIPQLGPGRAQNLRLSAVLPDAAKAVGREFFLHAQLVSGGKTLAEDTVTYAVVAPRQTDPKDLAKSRFIAFGDGTTFRDSGSQHAEQSVTAKMGVSMTQSWDYSGWRDSQPARADRSPSVAALIFPSWSIAPTSSRSAAACPIIPGAT